jgi:hypothetical protein
MIPVEKHSRGGRQIYEEATENRPLAAGWWEVGRSEDGAEWDVKMRGVSAVVVVV